MLRTTLCASALLLAACETTHKCGPNMTPEGHCLGARNTVSIPFSAEISGAPWDCESSYEGLDGSQGSVVPLDLRFYVHDVSVTLTSGEEVPLHLEPDGMWQTEHLALLDFENRRGTCANGTEPTNMTIRGHYRGEGSPVGLRFRMGVPLSLNHQLMTSAPTPLNLSGLYWSWLGGYKFLRLELEHEGAETTLGDETHGLGAFSVHIGSTGCEMDPKFGEVRFCERENRGEIYLQGWGDEVVFDVGHLLKDVDFGEFGAPSRGCMATLDEQNCELIFERLGIDFESGRPKVMEGSAFQWR